MITHTDRLVLVFPIASKNRPAAASLQTLTILDNGREIEDLVPIDPASAGDYAEAFSLGLIAERDALAEQVATLTAEVSRLTLLVPPPVPDAFLNADWPQFRVRILSDPAVQRVAVGNSTAWPLMVLYLAQLSSTPSRGLDIAQLWTFMESQTPVTSEEVSRINAIAIDCGVPLQMNEDGSIG